MTQQIIDVLYKLDDSWRNENEVIVLTAYINSLEQRIAKYEFEMECYRQCEEQLKACETALEEAEQRIAELMEIHSNDNSMFTMYQKRIAELEEELNTWTKYPIAIESPKTCEGCKYHYYIKSKDLDMCGNDVTSDVSFMHGEAVIINANHFYCSCYTPKDKE